MLESHCSNQAGRQHMVTQPLETNLRMILSLLQIPCSVLEWKGFRHQRVLRSILPLQQKRHLWTGRKMQRIVAEACWQKLYNLYTLMHGHGIATHGIATHGIATSFAERRVAMYVTALRQNCRN